MVSISKVTKIYGINKTLLSWRKTDNSLSSDVSQKFYDAYKVYKNIENKNALITIFLVLRLSIFYLIKKISQKLFNVFY